MEYKNSEGYADPTAYYGERRAERKPKKKRLQVRGYMIGELYCFKLAIRKMG